MCEENHRDVTKPKIKGNQTLAEVHLGRFQNRAADGDGGRGVSEWSDADANRKSNLHSGRFQKRSGARLVTKFEPRRNFVGYGRGRGEVVAEEPVSDWETSPMSPHLPCSIAIAASGAVSVRSTRGPSFSDE